jgi:hypothetical protein
VTDQPLKHGEQHNPRGPDAIQYVALHIALSGDRDEDDPVIVEDNVFRPPMHEDVNGLRLKRLSLGLGVASSSGSVSIAIENETQAVSMLTGAASLGAGAQYAEVSSVIADEPDNVVAEGDVLRIDITAAGTDAKGLKAMLIFW